MQHSKAMHVLSRLRTYTKESFFFDLFIIITCILVLTGGYELIETVGDPLKTLVHQKPWIHRLTLSSFLFLFLTWYGLREFRFRKEKSPLLATLKTLYVSPKQIVWICFILSSALMTIGPWVRHEVFHTNGDAAIFSQAIWNLLHGEGLHSSIKGGMNILGDHFSPFLFALAVPYAIWSDPKCLLLIQSLTTVACIFPIFRIAALQLKDETIACLFAISFILYLPARNAVRFDFHPELVVAPLFLWAFYFVMRERYLISSFLLCICLTPKENAALVTFVFGLYGLLFCKGHKGRLFGLFWVLFSLLYFFGVTRWVIPTFFGTRYGYLGNYSSWKEDGFIAFLHYALNGGTLVYLIKIFAPLGFLSFLHPPTLLLTMPMLAQNILARNDSTRSIFFQYTALLTPFVFVSAIFGAKRLLRGVYQRRFLSFYLIACALLFAGVSEYYIIRMWSSKRSSHLEHIKEYFKTIPPSASVRTHAGLAPHLAHRREVHIYANEHPLEGGSPQAQNAQMVVIDRLWLGEKWETDVVALQKRGYAIVHEKDGFFVFERRRE